MKNQMLIYGGIGLVVLVVIAILLMKRENYAWSASQGPVVNSQGQAQGITIGSYSTTTGGSATYGQGASLMLETDSSGNLSTSATLPIGAIIMWAGNQNTIPTGWLICDGNNNTPNLLGRFPFGAYNDSGIEQTGGASNVQLVPGNVALWTAACNASNACPKSLGSGGTIITGLGDPIASVGGGPLVASPSVAYAGSSYFDDNTGDLVNGLPKPFNIMPPYLGVYFIMKMQ